MSKKIDYRRLHVYIPTRQYEWLRREAYKQNQSISEIVRAIISTTMKGDRHD